ncbi:hypothetical protein [Aurantivibrio plasticivorans]
MLMIKVPNIARIASAALLYCLLSGCANTLLVEGDFPDPLIEPIPINVGVHFSDDFESFQYTEESNDRDKWIIVLGDTQQHLFEIIFRGMFSSLHSIDSSPPWESTRERDFLKDIDIVLIPQVNEFQYTLPSETKINVYEVWIQYNIKAYTATGDLLADWILTAYGKTPDGFMQSSEGALNQAIVVALRDAGANLALNFKQVPELRAWLAEREPAIVKKSTFDSEPSDPNATN